MDHLLEVQAAEIEAAGAVEVEGEAEVEDIMAAVPPEEGPQVQVPWCSR